MRIVLLVLPCLIVAMSSCQKQSSSPDKGVSLALNDRRKQTLKDIRYDVIFDIPSQKSQQIQGVIQITFNLNALDSALVLDFNADSSFVKHVRIKDKQVDYQFVNEHIIIPSRYLNEGGNSIQISFIAGNLSLNCSEDYLYTLFVPDRASTCFPLFDQPNLKASYQLTLKTPGDWEAVSNGKLISKAREGERGVYRFAETKPISSYLFAFAAGKFFKASKQIDGREMTMYYRETDTAKVNRNRDEVFELHAKSLAWLEDYTAVSYPFGKFDFVLLPSFQYGGMEHPGAVFYNESALFLDENPSVNRLMARASVIAHESAHMWFGDLVTMDWFNDVWLKEVFANFMAAKIVQPSFPEINHELRFLLAHYPNAYEIDRTRGTNPILQELGNLKNAGTLYGAIIYMKAPIVMRKLEKMIGADLMQQSLREYLRTYAFKNARWDDLIGIIDRQTPQNIAQWSNVWVKTPGMPAYEIGEKDYKTILTQVTDSVSGRIWEQPLTSKERDTQDGKLVFPNGDGIGYGYFRMDSLSKRYFITHYNEQDSIFSDPVFKGAMWVNIWEGFLRESQSNPEALIDDLLETLPKENNPLLIDYMLGILQTNWWIFAGQQIREAKQESAEKLIWKLLIDTKDKGIKTSYFRAFKNLVQTPPGLEKLRSLWNGKLDVKDLVLSEDDKISMAYELALKQPEVSGAVLQEQLRNTKNPDRKARFQFVIPALDSAETVRDRFFESLQNETNREKEAWVIEALGFLHHPLRARGAVKYLRPSLNILKEIQLTGDIFFPTRWLHGTFSGHSSREAAQVVNAFLAENQDYPQFLENKILQETDMLQRAAR
ncbi:M1 family metallopeptidase [Dyadobacter aurulentus]|uniref:M1 family metallopeptidase n=1 Tax=Dyadobacter sp. UC 10 TaxID=2605428 RepID=UPI001CED6AEC|nr:M1 family aminopeptidase [Dyadobacter sp. UC 10]